MALKNSKWMKIIAALLALCMMFSFTGCDKEPDESSDISSDTSNENSVPQNLHKVGYIFSGSADEEFSFSWLMNQQRIKVSNRCSMETCYVENVALNHFEDAVKLLQAEGCTDIVAASSNFANIVKTVSARYMNLNFIGYGVASNTINTAGYTEHIYQGAYVAGMVAAYNSQTRNIGFVGDSDLIQTIAVTNAVTLGAQLVFKKSNIYSTGAHSDKDIEQAVNYLLNNNCDVIVCYTDSPHAEEYCQQRGVKFIGNSDFSGKEDKYSKMLMYYYCKRDSYFLSQFKRMQMDSWNAETSVGTMGNGSVVVSKALDACEDNSTGRKKEDTQRLMNRLLPYISSEAAYIFSGEGKDGELIDRNGIVKVMQGTIMSYSDIYNMNWYVQGVQDYKAFRDTTPPTSSEHLEVKY